MEAKKINPFTDLTDFLQEPNAYRSLLILALAIVLALVISQVIAKVIIKLAQVIATKSDDITDQERLIKYRQTETYLSIAVAVVRAATVAIVAYFVWSYVSPISNSGAAAIGAGAFFIVFAGQTLGIVLRDVTAGAAMIAEGWFHVGDFIKIEPFIEVSGIVERFTLRSTKLRSLNGDSVWIHNQQMQAVHVTPNGLRTFSIDLFSKQLDEAEAAIKELVNTMPSGPTMLSKPLKLVSIEEWTNGLWRFTVVGKTAPGREWLIENFFVNAIKLVDEGKTKSKRIFIYEPIARYSDPVADSRFKRTVR